MEEKHHAILLCAALVFSAVMVFVGIFGEAGEEIPSYSLPVPAAPASEAVSDTEKEEPQETGVMPATPAEETKAPVEKPLPSEMVNVNTAGLEELMTLPGIGEVTAGSILSYREEYGPFGNVDELTRVKGIGEAKLEKIRPYVCV